MDKMLYSSKSFWSALLLAFVLPFIFVNNVRAENPEQKEIKLALIYTVTTPELKADVVREIKHQVGEDVKLLVYEAPEVFQTIKREGYVSAASAAKMIKYYMSAVEDGADVILSICSTVEDIAYNSQTIAKYTGIPIVLVNDEMCREAVRKGRIIAVVSTFETSISPTKNTLQRVAREMNRKVDLHEVIVDGGFGLEEEKLKALMADRISRVADEVDVIIFTQGSMAYIESYIEDKFQKEVLTNPYYSIRSVKKVLQEKGLIVE